MSNFHEKWIKHVKACGQSIIDNAESIVGTEQYLSDITVSFSISPHEFSQINVDRNFYPEQAPYLPEVDGK